MFRHPIVKPAFHLSWFLLLLGGVSLFEKSGWGIPGAIMFIVGLIILAFTAFAIYLKKPFLNEPGWLLILSIGLIGVLVFAQVVFGKYLLAGFIAALATPIVMGWVVVKGQKSKSPNQQIKKASKSKRKR